MKFSDKRHIFIEGYKAGYKKVVKETKMAAKFPPKLIMSFVEAIEECDEAGEGVGYEAVIDHWQQVYGDDYLYNGKISPLLLGGAYLEAAKRTNTVKEQPITGGQLVANVCQLFSDYLDL